MSRVSGAVKIHDRNELLLAGVNGRRCRLQGLNDAKLYTGWIATNRSGLLSIVSSSAKNPNPGDFLYVEVDIQGATVTFVAYVSVIQSKGYELKITSDVDERPSKAEPRMLVGSSSGRVQIGGVSYSITVTDISENGFGFLCLEEFPTGGCKAMIDTANGVVTIAGDIRYCRKDLSPDNKRGGVKILQMDRVSRARWAKLMESNS